MENEPQSFFIEKTFIPKKLGDLILSTTPYKAYLDEIYRYDAERGVYVAGGEERLKEHATLLLGNRSTIQHTRETLEYIRAVSRVYEEPNGWLNLGNGLLRPLTGMFEKHTPDVFTFSQIPIHYDPVAECPVWLGELNKKLDATCVALLQEFFGYCFMQGQPFEKALLIFGPPKTMKSTALTVLEWLLGEDNYSAFSLQALNDDRFTKAYLLGKFANIYADLPASSLKNTDTFLLITGGDAITAEKKHCHPFTFRPGAKLVFSCNKIPATSNKNLAFYRRWILIPFLVQHEKDDTGMRERLKKELPGILNWALEGMKRLRINGGFSFMLPPEQIKDLYERNSDTVQSFIFKYVVDDDEETETKRKVRKAYEEYCRTHSLDPVNHIRFGREFKELSGCGVCKKDKLPAYSGIKLKGEEEDRMDTLLGYR